MTQVTPSNFLDQNIDGLLLEGTDHGFDLLCDEVWDMSPLITSCGSQSDHHHMQKDCTDIENVDSYVHSVTKQECKHLFDAYLCKEVKYMTGSGYVKFLESNGGVCDRRLKAINWFIHCWRKFNFCIGTVFNAVNYVDRFMDMNKCHGWSYWMMELLSLACLSIAIKFGETCPPSLSEIQEGLQYCFEPKLIQNMELKVLKSLGWELNSITPYSYVDLIDLELNRDFKTFVRSRLDEVLLASSLDVELLQYRPCVIAMSGLRCILDDEHRLSHITSFIPGDQKQNIQSCYNMIQEILVRHQKSSANPSSPDSVLTKDMQVAIHDEQVDLSFMDEPTTKDNLKRKRVDDDDDCGVIIKKYVK